MVCRHDRSAEDNQASGAAEALTRGETMEEDSFEVNGLQGQLGRDSVPSLRGASQRPEGGSLGSRFTLTPPALSLPIQQNQQAMQSVFTGLSTRWGSKSIDS